MITNWKVIILAYLHVAAFYGIFVKYSTASYIVGGILIFLGQIGTTVVAHRYFAHRSFEFNDKLKIYLVILQTFAPIGPIIDYVQNHRMHHKFNSTNADPHNSKRGFLFSHIGWLVLDKHPDLIKQSETIKNDDLKHDDLLQYQKKNYFVLFILMQFVIPLIINIFILGESFIDSWHWNLLRLIILLHWTLALNSIGHFIGSKPYDKEIVPRDSLVLGVFGLGEGYNNFHHLYPWDYKTSETHLYPLNISSAIIDLLAVINMVSKRKTAPKEIIEKLAIDEGDGSHHYVKALNKIYVNIKDIKRNDAEVKKTVKSWGYGDDALEEVDEKLIKILQ